MTGNYGVPGAALLDAQGGNLQSIQIYDVDLSTPRTGASLAIQGTPFWGVGVDPAGYDNAQSKNPSSSVYAGTASIAIGRQTMDPVRLEGGSWIECPATDKFWITNAAQSGKMLRLYLCPPPWKVRFYLKQDAPFVAALSTGQVAVTDVATLITPALAGRTSFMFSNDGSVPMWFGPTSGVTTVTGKKASSTQSTTINDSTTAIYAICAAGQVTTVSYALEG